MVAEAWRDFEQQVADLFRLKGFTPLANTIFAGRQHDLILSTGDEAVQPILVECKYHEPEKRGVVSVEELEDFAARVIRLRSSGDISTGYLVTNTAFSANARGALSGRPEAKFVLLRSVAEIRRTLIGFDRYLASLASRYISEQWDANYEPLKATMHGTSQRHDAVDMLRQFVRTPEPSLCVLTGDYGTGKTTVLTALAYRLTNDLRSDGAGRLPILIPLKWYNQAGGAIALLRRFLDEHALGHATVDALLAMHAAGQLVLLFDGFDEMLRRSTEQTRRETLQEIAELCTVGTKVVLSGRSSYFASSVEFRAPFQTVGISGVRDRIAQITHKAVKATTDTWSWCELAPLEPHQVRSFLLRKTTAASERERQKRVDRIVNTIENTYNLGDLARRPILLEMMAATLGRDDAQAVTNPAELYDVYVDTWLRIDADKGAFRRLISPDDRLDFSTVLAWVFQDRGIQEISWRELQALVGDYFRLEEPDDLDHFGADIRTCTFLHRDGRGYFSFAHLSFQEYFCARFLVEGGDERLTTLFNYILTEPDVTLQELSERSPATLDFAGYILGCPVNPSFWQRARELVSLYPNRVAGWFKTTRGKRRLPDSMHLMLRMADGEGLAFDLSDIADAYRKLHHHLRDSIAEELTITPRDEWLAELALLFERGRV